MQQSEIHRVVDHRTMARLRGLVEKRSDEVSPMVERLATAHAPDRLQTAVADVLADAPRFEWASELERAILVELGIRGVNTSPSADHSRVLRANEIQDRRARGMDCRWCHDSGWFIPDDDDEHAPTAIRCTHDYGDGPPPEPSQPTRSHYEPRTDPATAYEAIAAARATLDPESDKPEATTCRHGVPLGVTCRRCQFAQPRDQGGE